MPTEHSVCVYCSSSESVDARLRAVAADLGLGIAARGWRLVYGGGDVGLMGEVARAALRGGAHVTGVIPHRLADREVALGAVPELIRVDSMRQRKQIMDERADAFVILPGGIGTLEEMMEVMTLKQLAFHDRPIVLVDPDGFWEPLWEQFNDIVSAGLASPGILDLLLVTVDVGEALDAVGPRGVRPASAEGGAGALVDGPDRPQP